MKARIQAQISQAGQCAYCPMDKIHISSNFKENGSTIVCHNNPLCLSPFGTHQESVLSFNEASESKTRFEKVYRLEPGIFWASKTQFLNFLSFRKISTSSSTSKLHDFHDFSEYSPLTSHHSLSSSRSYVSSFNGIQKKTKKEKTSPLIDAFLSIHFVFGFVARGGRDCPQLRRWRKERRRFRERQRMED